MLGTSKQVISRYETNQRSPKISIVKEYASKLNIPIEILLGTDLTTEKLANPKANELTPEEQEAIELLRQASPEQRKAVLTLLRGK